MPIIIDHVSLNPTIDHVSSGAFHPWETESLFHRPSIIDKRKTKSQDGIDDGARLLRWKEVDGCMLIANVYSVHGESIGCSGYQLLKNVRCAN